MQLPLLDNNINEQTAQYFCIFAKKELQQYLHNINDNKQIIKSTETIIKDKSLSLNEADNPFVKLVNKVGSGANAMAANTAGAVTKQSTQAAIDTISANQNTINNIAHDAASSATKGVLKTVMPWIFGAGAIALGYKLWPNIKGLFNRMTRTVAKTDNSIAFVKFKDTDNNDWQFYFSIDKMLWKLDNMNSNNDIPKKYIVSFMKTDFAKRFMSQCQMIITGLLDNKLNTGVIYKMCEKDKAKQNFISNIIKHKDDIYANMFTGKC